MTHAARPAADPTEAFRHRRIAELNPGVDRVEVERRHGRVWDPGELAIDFEVVAFAAPLVVVRRKADGRRGTLEFQHHPRLYFGWQEDR